MLVFGYILFATHLFQFSALARSFYFCVQAVILSLSFNSISTLHKKNNSYSLEAFLLFFFSWFSHLHLILKQGHLNFLVL